MNALPFRDLTEAAAPFSMETLLFADVTLSAVIAAAVDVARAERVFARTPFGDRERTRFTRLLQERLDEAGIAW